MVKPRIPSNIRCPEPCERDGCLRRCARLVRWSHVTSESAMADMTVGVDSFIRYTRKLRSGGPESQPFAEHRNRIN